MFLLYAIAIGLLAGRLLGGRLDRLADARFRWAPLALVGMLIQVALFSPPLGGIDHSLGVAIYVGSTAAVMAVVVRNIRLGALGLVAVGALANMVAIVANGGFMPASGSALAAAGRSASAGYSNSVLSTSPAVALLTDIFALPAWIPLANVFSIGDVLIGLGIAITIGLEMGRPDDRAMVTEGT